MLHLRTSRKVKKLSVVETNLKENGVCTHTKRGTSVSPTMSCRWEQEQWSLQGLGGLILRPTRCCATIARDSATPLRSLMASPHQQCRSLQARASVVRLQVLIGDVRSSSTHRRDRFCAARVFLSKSALYTSRCPCRLCATVLIL